MAETAEFPGYYIVGGRKLTPDGSPYKSGKQDPEELTPEQQEIANLKAELHALRTEQAASTPKEPAKPETPKAPEAPKAPATPKP